MVVRVQLLDEDHDEAEGNCPRGKKPGYREPFRQDSGRKRVTRISDGAEMVPCIAIDCVRLKSFDGRPKNGEEARDDWHDEQAVDQVEFVAIVAWQIARFEHLWLYNFL